MSTFTEMLGFIDKLRAENQKFAEAYQKLQKEHKELQEEMKIIKNSPKGKRNRK